MIRGALYRLRRFAGWAWRTALGPGRHFSGAAPARRWVLFTENFNATYFISFEVPLRHLQRSMPIAFSAYSQQDVEDATSREWEDWILARRPEAVVLTRYGRPDGPQILAFCRAHGIPTVYHIDDDLLELPPTLGDDILQRNAGNAGVAARAAMLEGCDLVYASTSVLAGTLQRRFPGRPVVHGMYAPFLPVEGAAGPGAGTREVIGYMGSRGHRHDLALAVPALVRLLRERPHLAFETFGTIEMPSPLLEFGGRVKHHRVNSSYGRFLRKLAGLGWRIGLAPLEDTPFNRCKAPTKFIEYTSCGIATVASDVVVYASAMPAGTGELVRDDWYAALTKLLDDSARTRGLVDAARAHCAREYGVARLAGQLLEVLDRVRAGTRAVAT